MKMRSLQGTVCEAGDCARPARWRTHERLGLDLCRWHWLTWNGLKGIVTMAMTGTIKG